MSNEKFTLFWGGVFSNWHPCIFETDDMMFNCVEQYMMYHKAMLFDDQESADKIMLSKSPREQKALGRKVSNFDKDEWENVAWDIVHEGCRLKFQSDSYLLAQLLATEGTTLVEASPYDKIWGIGLDAKNPDAMIREKWQGTNWLGEILTDLREQYE